MMIVVLVEEVMAEVGDSTVVAAVGLELEAAVGLELEEVLVGMLEEA